MQKIWKKLSKLDKISIYVFITMLIVMILGLILIGVANMPERTINIPDPLDPSGGEIFFPLPKQNGFDILKSLSIGQVLSHSGSSEYWNAYWSSGAWLTLQFGCSLSVIVTPILLFTSLIIFGYSCYLKVVKK